MLSRRAIGASLMGKRWNSTYQLSKLANGVKVATVSTPGHFATTGIFVDAGSRYETPSLTGSSHILDRMAFKSTENYTGKEIQEKLELLGGNHQCISSRESMMYQGAVFTQNVKEMFKLISETVARPVLNQEELDIQKWTAQYEVQEILSKPELYLPEVIHQVAFNNRGLGNPLLIPEQNIESMSVHRLEEYRSKLYNPGSITAAFVGIPHEQSLAYAEEYLGHLKQLVPKAVPEKSVYTGGYLNIPSLEGYLEELNHVLVAYEGVSFDDPDVYALSVLQTLLGSGGSFSAGGPGKGMYSRAYTQVLNRYYFVENIQTFNHSYTDSGLFGISIAGQKDFSQALPKIIDDQLTRVTLAESEGGLTEQEVARAKKQVRSSLLMAMESKMIELEDLGRQVQVRGKRIPYREVVDKIEKLTVEDIRKVAKRVLYGNGSNVSRPTIVTLGNPHYFNDLESIFTN